MYEFKVNRKDNSAVEYKGYNGTGQLMILNFEKWVYRYSHEIQWYISFYIKDKRKHDCKFNEQTGTDGLRSLMWAKDCIKDFIENVINDGGNHTIIIYWTDVKRKKAYARYLKDLKFNLSRMDRREALILKIGH